MKKVMFAFVLLILFASFSSALLINSVDSPKLIPGQEATVKIEIRNNLDSDAENVVLSLDFSKLPINSVIGSSDSVDLIESDDEETFIFRVKASSSAEAGDYDVPYTITYDIDSTNATRTGTISLSVSAEPELEFSVEAEKPVIGEKTKLTLRIVNKGLGDAKFLSLKMTASGIDILSEPASYIGTIASDDFETESFDAIVNSANAVIKFDAVYKNADNEEKKESFVVPIEVYSREKALELGIIQKGKTLLYVEVVIVLFVIYWIYRVFKKRKMKRNLQRN